GFTALRIRGLMLTATTLAFAVMCEVWLFSRPWAFGRGVYPGRPIFAGHALTTGSAYYLFAVPVFLFGFWIAWNVNRSGLRRLLIAVRDNEDGARAFGLYASRLKLQGFAV